MMIVSITSASSASIEASINPLIEDEMTFQPSWRTFAPTIIAISASSTIQPVATANPRPIKTPIDVTTSVLTCRPSARSAGDFSALPVEIKSQAQYPLISAAMALIAMPSAGSVILCSVTSAI